MELQALLALPKTLPPVPDVAAALIESLDNPDVDLESLAELIETDPVLTAKIIRGANSAFFGLLRPVHHPRQAVAMLGLVKVRTMALAAMMNDSFAQTPGIELERFWRYSLTTANLARYVAAPLGVEDNAVYTAGLIHAIGELMLHMGMPEAMAQLNQQVPPFDLRRADAELAAFGYTYTDAGAALARQWRFPKRMVAGLEHQLNPFEQSHVEPIAAVVHLAAWRARVAFSDIDLASRIASYPDAVGVALGVDPDALMGDAMPPLQNMGEKLPL